MRSVKAGVSRSVIAIIIVVIVIIIGAGAYAALNVANQTTTTQQSTSSSTQTGSSSTSSSSLSSSSQSSQSSSSTQTTVSTSTSMTSSVPNPKKLVYDYVLTPHSLDPHQWTDGGSNMINQQVYETLFGYLPGSSALVPWIAANYTASPDGLTFTINLRQGIKFQDGTDVNASAVVFNILRDVLKDSTTTDQEGFFGAAPGLINGSYYFSHSFGVGSASYNQSQVNAFINSNPVVVGSNPSQVIFHLGYASAAFLSDLTLGGQMLSPSYVIAHWTAPTDGHGYITGVTAGETDPWMANHTMGTGPFMVKSWDTTTGNVVLESNPNYWGSPMHSGPSNLTEVDLNFVQSNSARVLDLKSGASDVSDISPADYFAFIDKTSWLDHQTINLTVPGVLAPGPYARNTIIWIGFNFVIHNPDGSVASFQPLANKNFRVAMADSVNITDIVKSAANGFGSPANTVLPPGTIGHNDSIPTFWNYNLTDAQGNLTIASSQLGFNSSHSQTASIVYGIGDSTGEATATEMATNINNMGLGITVQPVPIPVSLLITELVDGQIGMYVLDFPATVTDPSLYLTAFGVTQEAAFQGYNNSVVRSLVLNQSSELNATLRLQMVNQIQYLMNKDVFEIWLYYPSVIGEGGNGDVGQFFRTWVHGFQFNGGRASLYFYGLWKG